jgi:quinol monooxygenase YgiN
MSKIAFFVAAPGKGKQLGDALLALVEPTRQEDGSLRYEIFQHFETENVWIVVEDWTSREAFDHHMNTPYVRRFLGEVPSLCDGSPDIRTYQKRSSTDTR